ncbi:MAG: hypothetical protein EZS28_026521, partial [Streblomastix strix]
SVDHIIKQKAVLSGGTIRAISKQLFEGLHLIHSKGLVHRDIKGENIMLHCPFGSNRFVVKIADFGLVKVSGGVQQTMLMSSKGTPLNMAPELVNGDGKADAKVDVWSAGVVVFQLAGHEYPIKANSLQDLSKLMQLKTITRPASIQDDLLWDLLLHLLDFDRKTRFSAEQALQHPYFTSFQALNDISDEARSIAASALQAQQVGDRSVTAYDTDVTYTVSGTEIKKAINYNPDVDLQPIYNQIPEYQQRLLSNQHNHIHKLHHQSFQQLLLFESCVLKLEIRKNFSNFVFWQTQDVPTNSVQIWRVLVTCTGGAGL